MKSIVYMCGNQAANLVFAKAYIIDSCNYNCSYCYNKKPRTGLKIDLLVLLNALHIMHLQSKKKIVVELIGGEPMLHNEIGLFISIAQASSHIALIVVYSNFSFEALTYASLLVQNSKLNFDFSWHHASIYADKMFLENAKFMASLPDDAKKRMTFSIMYEHSNISKSIILYKLIHSMGLMAELLLVGRRIGSSFVYEYSNKDYERYLSILENDALKNIYAKYDDGSHELLTDALLVNMNSSISKYLMSVKGWKCFAGCNRIYIYVDGNAYRCLLEFETNVKPLYNIYIVDSIYVCNTPVICSYDQCACEYFIEKYAI